MEREGIEKHQWLDRLGEQEMVYSAYLFTDKSTPDLFQAVANLLDRLNREGLQLDLPQLYFYLDMGWVRALGLDKQYDYVASTDGSQASLFLYPSMTVPEYLGSKIPRPLPLGVSSGSKRHYEIALEMFDVKLPKDADLIHGSIRMQDKQWAVRFVFDIYGWGCEEYKERLKSLGCPVIEDKP
jgi:hypothetical protein